MNEDLKKFISKYLIQNNGRLYARSKEEWFIRHNFENVYHEIINKTSFLKNAFHKGQINAISFHERIYCIFNDVIENSKCIICGDKTKFSSLCKNLL